MKTLVSLVKNWKMKNHITKNVIAGSQWWMFRRNIRCSPGSCVPVLGALPQSFRTTLRHQFSFRMLVGGIQDVAGIPDSEASRVSTPAQITQKDQISNCDGLDFGFYCRYQNKETPPNRDLLSRDLLRFWDLLSWDLFSFWDLLSIDGIF